MSQTSAVGISKTTFMAGLILAVLASSAISTAVSMQWAMGPRGDKGDQGDTGLQGSQGIQGLPGINGSQGIQGPQGLMGIQGNQGEQGPPGTFTIENMTGFLPAPAYDSGWVQIGYPYGPYILEHNLHTTEVLIYAYSNTSEWVGFYCGYWGSNHHLWWYFNDTTLSVYADPFTLGSHDQFRIMMWKLTGS